MLNPNLAGPKETVARHLTALREYVRRVIIRGESLAPQEEDDRVHRMQEYLAVSSSFNVTQKEMVALLYKGFFAGERGCGCHACRARTLV